MKHANFDGHIQAAEDILSALQEKTDDDLRFYADCVRTSFAEFEPVFTRERYADFFLHCACTVPGWTAATVLANAKKESDGAGDLLKLWAAIKFDQHVQDKVLFHAYDECRHSRLFVDLTNLAFPNLLATERASSFKQGLIKIEKSKLVKSDYTLPEQHLIDHLIQMNMGEIRTRIHIKMLAPVINAFTPKESRLRIESILNGLISDEEVHVSYTAKFINQWCEDGNEDAARTLFQRRLRDFDRYTRMETHAAVTAYGNGQFPDLMEI